MGVTPLASLAVKYRPKTLDEVCEQPIVVKILKSICEEDNLGCRNFLLIGPAGVAKTATVHEYCKLLGLPCVEVDMTAITKAGYIGDNIKGEYISNYCILRMMIEAKHQNKGLGKLALKQLIEIIKSISVNETFIWVSTEEKNAKAIHVYEMNGFKKTKDYCGEEIILKYDLSK